MTFPTSNAPLLHYRAKDAEKPSLGYPGHVEAMTLCGSWYPVGVEELGSFFIDDAPMGGILCALCKHRDEHPAQYRAVSR